MPDTYNKQSWDEELSGTWFYILTDFLVNN